MKLLQLSQGNSFYIDKALDSPSFEKSLRVAAVKAYDHPQIITYVVNNEKRYFIGPVSMYHSAA